MKESDRYLKGLSDFKEYLSISLWQSDVIKDTDCKNDFDSLIFGVFNALVDSHEKLIVDSSPHRLSNKLSLLSDDLVSTINSAFVLKAKDYRLVEDKTFDVDFGIGLNISKQELLNNVSKLVDKYLEGE